jgi:hypothetical protein
MRTIRDLPIAQDGNNTLFPDGQIKNETATEAGTPVVREIYGDVITNIYKIIRDAGVEFTETEDSESTQYQFLDALKVFSNETNDLLQVLSVEGTDVSINVDLDSLPNNYIFIGQVSEPLLSSTTYELTGTGINAYSFNPESNINANSQVLLIINNSSGVKLIDLSKEVVQNTISLPYSGVLSYNSTEETYYLSDGFILKNTPQAYNVQQVIRVDEGDNDILIYDALIHKGVLICMAKTPSATVYDMYMFDLSDLSTVANKQTLTQQSSTDHAPYLFADQKEVYISNLGNNDADDFKLRGYVFTAATFVFNQSSDITLNSDFQKSTNYFIKNSKFYTFINGDIYSYPFTGGTRNFENFLNNTNGQVFTQEAKIYFKSGFIGNLWNI